MKSLLIFLSGSLLLAPCPLLSAAERVAIVIGNSLYDPQQPLPKPTDPKDPGNPNLPNPVNDAALVHATFKNLGFTLIPEGQPLTNATRQQMLTNLNLFVSKARGAELAVIYYAGHGAANKDSNHIIPVDAFENLQPTAGVGASEEEKEADFAAQLESFTLSHTQLLDKLKNADVKARVLVLDCCRDSGLAKKTFGLQRDRSSGGDGGMVAINRNQLPPASLVMFSAGPGETAKDGAGRNSVFTENFAKQIQTGKDIYVALRDVSVEVKKAVTRQTPWLESFGDAAALADIRFAPASYVAPPPVPTGMTEEEVQRRVAEALAKMVPKVDPRSGGVPPPSVTTPSAGPGTAAGSTPLLGSSILDQGSIGKVIQIKIPGGQVMKFAYCPPGSFTMGSPASEADRGSDEDQVEVTLSRGFWMAQTECTQAQWQAVMGTSIQEQAKLGTHGKDLYGAGADLPMYYVSHDEASAFCEKVQGSVTLPAGWKVALPSEAQWEYACRAGTSGAYAGTLDRLAWYSDNSDSTTHAVAGKQANAWGLYDMHGNVWEWCADGYDSELPGGTDPRGATTGAYRVNRGGSWGNDAAYCRAALRGNHVPGYRYVNLGFRPALVPSR